MANRNRDLQSLDRCDSNAAVETGQENWRARCETAAQAIDALLAQVPEPARAALGKVRDSLTGGKPVVVCWRRLRGMGTCGSAGTE